MKAFWQQRSTRERILLILVAGVILIATATSTLAPLLSNQAFEQQQIQFEKNLAFIHWAERAKPYLSLLKSLPAKTSINTQQDLPTQLRQSLHGTPLGEALSTISQVDNQLTLTFKHAPFDALMQELNGWENSGLTIQQLTAQATADKGYCDVTIKLATITGATRAS